MDTTSVQQWQRAAIGLFALSLVMNTAQSALIWKLNAAQWETTFQLAQAEQTRDYAIEQLGAVVLQSEQDKQARAEQAAAFEAVSAYRYIGECVITAYCPCAECCGKWADGLTATGIPAGPGIVAVDPSVIPLGSTVIIDGQQYLAADTGGAVKGLHIDVCFAEHAAAKDFGVQMMEVWVVTE